MSEPTSSSAAQTPAPSHSGTSYPSPVSTAGSPHMEDNSQPLAIAHTQPQARPDTHVFRAPSATTEAAYRRIRQVRQSLIELSEPAAATDYDSQYLDSSIGPGHSALLLSTSPVEESSDTDDVIDFQSARSNLAAVERQTQHYLDRFAPTSWSDHHQPHSHPSIPELPRHRRQVQLPSPSLSAEPLQQNTIPRRSVLETQLARRRDLLNSDDPATFIGRRVAAREAAGPSRSAEQPSPSHTDQVLRAVEMERELLHLRNLSHQRRTDPGMNARMDRADAMSRSDIIRAARSLDMESFRAGQRPQPSNITTNAPAHARPLPNPRRWRAYRAAAESRQNSNATQSPASAHPHSHPDRLSMLSNFSVQNLTTPTSAVARDRPLLFEEPLSYAGQRRESRDIAESPIGSERSYFIHRRVNADGDELVHNINLEWDDEDPLSWLMPSGRERETPDYSAFPRRRFGTSMFEGHDRNENARGARGLPPMPERRPRGWARLDADGNAIPSDEEEELERSRAEYRIRALYQARASAAVVTSRAERRAQSSVDVPALDGERTGGPLADLITRTSVSPDDSLGRETTSPRVRLNSRDPVSGQRLGFGSVMDSVMAVDSTSRPRQTQATSNNDPYSVPYGSLVPFVVDPLPIPLSQMMPFKNEKKGRLAGVRVSSQAGFAGR